MIALEPVGVVVGGRGDAVDDDWGGVEAVIRLDGTRFGPDAVRGLGDFSHLVVVFQFHLVGESEVQTGARRPRGNPDWPEVGMFAQRARMRPNRLGVSACVLVRVDGPDLYVRGLDAVEGSPVLDVKPYMREFEPDGADVRQPDWATELMHGYYRAHPVTSAPRLVLASGSPARLRVLCDAGFDPEVVVSGVDEDVGDMGTAEAVVVLAERKASAVAPRCEDALVLGCDSLLELDGESLGKPASGAEVVAMWRRLSGRDAQLRTGHCLIDTRSGARTREVDSTSIRFGSPTDDEISVYAASGQALGLAGAFSIEGYGGPFVDGIDGVPSNVLGLSLPLLRVLLAKLGVPITDLWRTSGEQPG